MYPVGFCLPLMAKAYSMCLCQTFQHFLFSYCPQSSLFAECVSGNREGLDAEIRGFFCLSEGHKRLRGCYFFLWDSTDMEHGKMTGNPSDYSDSCLSQTVQIMTELICMIYHLSILTSS